MSYFGYWWDVFSLFDFNNFDYTLKKTRLQLGKSGNQLIKCWHRVLWSMSWSEDRASQLLVRAISRLSWLLYKRWIIRESFARTEETGLESKFAEVQLYPQVCITLIAWYHARNVIIERVEGKKRQEVEVSRDQHRNAWVHLVDSVWAVLSGAGHPQAGSASMLARKACRQAAAAF